MKKHSRGILSAWLIIAALTAGGTFMIYRHFIKNITDASVAPADGSTPGPALAADMTAAPQTFSGDGFSFEVPTSWYIEKNGKDSVTLYPDYSPASSDSASAYASSGIPHGAICKIEVSEFPYFSGTNASDWISAKLGADPSIAVTEQSSADIRVNGGTGVEWNGTIDGVLTTLVYAFSNRHAFEIAPSVVNETATDDGNAQCADALNTFIAQLTLE